MDRQGKAKLRESAAESFKKANAVIVAEYRGLTVEEMTALRRELRKANATFNIIKNRIAKKAIESDVPAMNVINANLKGPIGLVCAYGDAAQATKTMLEFEKEHPNLKVTAGFMEEVNYSVSQLKALADLPSKEVLLSKLVGSLVSPHRGLLGVMTGVHRQLLTVLNGIKDKKTA